MSENGTSPFGSAYTRATQSYTYWRTRPTWAQRVIGGVVLLILLGLAVLILVPALIIGAAVALIAAMVLAVRRFFGSATGPRSDTALRRNVRVREQV